MYHQKNFCHDSVFKTVIPTKGHLFFIRPVERSIVFVSIKEVAMQTTKEILERYKRAHMGIRLNMYLQYRDYRDAFLAVDMEESSTGEVKQAFCCGKRPKIQRRAAANPLRRFLVHVFAGR